MPDQLISQFDRKYAQPIETFRKVNNLSDRNSIPNGIRWEGMLVYVVSDQNTYQLTGGVSNSNWQNVGGYTDIFVVNNLTSNLTTAALSANQGRLLNEKFTDYQLLSEKGSANGYAPLGMDAKVPAAYLPAYVDDVVEYANLASFPATGETGKLYVALDTNFIYRWSGSTYIQIGGGGAGDVDSVFGRIGAVTAQVGDYSAFYVRKTGDTMTGQLTINGNELQIGGPSPRIDFVEDGSSNNWNILVDNGDLDFRQFGTSTVRIRLGSSEAQSFYSFYSNGGTAYTENGVKRTVGGSPYKAAIAINGGNGAAVFSSSYGGFLEVQTGNAPTGLRYYNGSSYQTVWHSGNDGPSSGLNADLVDGLNAGSFVRTDSSSTVGNFTTTLEGALSWRVSSADSAHQRADARDLGAESKLHWYGVDISGASIAAKHAFYNGSSYIDFTAISGGMQLGGNWTATNFIQSSDRRLKKNIKKFKAVDLSHLTWKTFDWKKTGDSQIGLIAQEVEKTNPEFVITDKETGFKSVKNLDIIIARLAYLESIILK